FKNCQVLDVNKKQALSKMEFQKIASCQPPEKTGIMALAPAVNGQCPATVPTTASFDASALSFAAAEELPTIQEYVASYFPKGKFQLPDYKTSLNPAGVDAQCDSRDRDGNGFFAFRPRPAANLPPGGCVHTGVDLRGAGTGSPIYDQPVKAMMSGKVVHLTHNYQGSSKPVAEPGDKGDFSIVIESGDFLIAYGHVTFKQGQAQSTPPAIGTWYNKGDVIGYPHPEIQKTNFGGELHINLVYTGANEKLQALTVKKMKTSEKYKRYFATPSSASIFPYQTAKLVNSKAAEFTFGRANLDEFFNWQDYAADLKPLTRFEPASKPPSDAQVTSSTQPRVSAPTNTVPIQDLCVYYYLDEQDAAGFYDVGIAAYGGDKAQCVAGRGAIAKSGIAYPQGYDAYVHVNSLSAQELPGGCFVAKLPLSKHGNNYPSGVYARMFLSQSQDVFSPKGNEYLDVGLARTEVSSHKIGNPTCQEFAQTYTSTAQTADVDANKRFLVFAKELTGAPYSQELRFSTKGADCSGIVTYGLAKMLSAGYTPQDALYSAMKQPGLTNYLADYNALNLPKVPIPPAALYPAVADKLGEALEKAGWEVPLDQAKPGDVALFKTS
ncbi:MAG: M23 family metallopeptidase, partial [Candidatus Micrarchaeota archaeon]|nr:M23 family metallopeptidase [Candidatus Micrarchaeota archaeon]